MRKLFLSAAAIFGAAIGTTSAIAGDTDGAANTDQAAPAKTGDEAKDKPKLVCQTVVETGTRIARRKKVCATRKEWQEVSDATADDFRGLSGNSKLQDVSAVPF